MDHARKSRAHDRRRQDRRRRFDGAKADTLGELYSLLDRLTKHIEFLATTDALTGLANRRHAAHYLDEVLEQGQEQIQPVSLIMVDVDHFKRVNDRFGHIVGDEILSNAARIVDQAVTPGSLAARFGGEEFVIILPGLGRDRAADIAEGIRCSFRQQIATPDGNSVTASFGVATFDGAGNFADAAGLVSAADQALYAAKHAGRDRVQVHIDPVKKNPSRGER